jgi:DNA-binding NarL/FixJ family response regulator
MEGKPAIWVIASESNTVRRVTHLFNKARLINPVKPIETNEELSAAFHPGYPPPRLILLDVSMLDGLCWEALNTLRNRKFESKVIALVDGESEALLDRAYEAGIKTYLRKDFTFEDFLERMRAVDLQLVLGTASIRAPKD